MKKIFHPVGHTLYSSVCNIFIFSISGFLCLYVGLKVPYETGFDQVKGSTHQAFSDCALNQLLVPGYQQVFAWTDLLIDFAFSFDLLINFFTGTHSQKYSIFLFFDYCSYFCFSTTACPSICSSISSQPGGSSIARAVSTGAS